MKVQILNLLEGAKKAKGLTVIIDVFRAFSTACYLYENKAKRIIPVGKKEIAYKLKKEDTNIILIGEKDGIKLPNFNYGNSPTQIQHINFKNKTIVHRTSAGTQGLIYAKYADQIITGSFVNAKAIIKYIQKINPKIVSLVAMGTSGIEKSDEDILCAKYIKAKLEHKQINFKNIKTYLKTYESSEKFFDKNIKWAPKTDFNLSLNLNKFNFVLKVEKLNKDLIYLKQIKIN